MNENVIKLQFKDKVETDLVEKVNQTIVQSNPIYKKMLAFHHAKIGDKLSISDILR